MNADERRAISEMVQAWAEANGPIAAARDDEAAGWRDLWPSLADLGAFSITVPTEQGGNGGQFIDLSAVLSELAAVGAPGPILQTALAAQALAKDGQAAGEPLLKALINGERAAAVSTPAASPLSLTGERVSGDLGVIDGIAPDSILLAPVLDEELRWCVLDASAIRIEAETSLSRTSTLGRVTVAHAEPLLFLDELDSQYIPSLQATLASAVAAGTARWAVRTAVEYAKIREQFGRTIGSFQAIKHLCAEMYCRAEQIDVVAWDAAVALDEGDTSGLSAATGLTVALDAAVANTKDAIQVLGGIGYTWEHDAHLYLRNALAQRQLLGGSGFWASRVAELVRSGVRRHITIELGEVEELRGSIAAEVTHIADLEGRQQRIALADAGLIAPGWPKPYGRAANMAEQLLISEELEKARVKVPDLVIGGWALPTILAHGTTEQMERFAMPTLRGDIVWCQLFSEPGAGSDLASLRTTARRVEDGWILNGQKVWTSLAREADFAVCLARTNPTAAKHRGISYFIVDMHQAGVEIRPLREITGDALFNEVFLDDVFVPDDCLVGAVDHGWAVTRTTLASERVEMSGGSGFAPNLEELISEPHEKHELAALGRLVAEASSVRLLAHRSLLQLIDGGSIGAESSVQKLLGVRHVQELSEHRLVRMGADGAAESDISWEFLSRRAWSIAGGSTQIVLSLIAERILGLPRDV